MSIGSPQPGDQAEAKQLLQQFEGALIAHEWRTAWDLLAAESQAYARSFAEFRDERSAYFQSAGATYTASEPVHDVAAIERWAKPGVKAFAPDFDRAFLTEIRYPALANNNAGWEILLLAPDKTASDAWRVWYLR